MPSRDVLNEGQVKETWRGFAARSAARRRGSRAGVRGVVAPTPTWESACWSGVMWGASVVDETASDAASSCARRLYSVPDSMTFTACWKRRGWSAGQLSICGRKG